MFNFYYSLVLAFGLFFEVTIKERKRKKKEKEKKSRLFHLLWIRPLGCSIVDPINTDFTVQLFLGIEASICFENFGCSNIKEIVKI